MRIDWKAVKKDANTALLMGMGVYFWVGIVHLFSTPSWKWEGVLYWPVGAAVVLLGTLFISAIGFSLYFIGVVAYERYVITGDDGAG